MGDVSVLDFFEGYQDVYEDELRYYQGRFNAYLTSNNSNISSGDCTYLYDYKTGKSFMNDNSLGVNNNPVQDSDSDTGFIPDDNSQIVSNGGNTLINNDNDSIIIEGNDSAKYLPTLINKLIPSDSGDGGLTDDFQSLSNSNGWLQYMSATFAFIPDYFWINLNSYFLVYVGILGVAFIIRIILDLL